MTEQHNPYDPDQPIDIGDSASCVPQRLLFIAAEFPYPPVHGGRADTWQRLKALVEAGARVQLVCWTTARRGGTPSADELQAVRAVVDDLMVLPISLTPANLARETAGLAGALALRGRREPLILTLDQRDTLTVAGHRVPVLPAWEWLAG